MSKRSERLIEVQKPKRDRAEYMRKYRQNGSAKKADARQQIDAKARRLWLTDREYSDLVAFYRSKASDAAFDRIFD